MSATFTPQLNTLPRSGHRAVAQRGHATLFRTFGGRLMLTLHQPNSGDIRARFFDVVETGETLRLAE